MPRRATISLRAPSSKLESSVGKSPATWDPWQMSLRIAATIAIGLASSTAAGQESLRRATIWDLKVGQPIPAQPSPDEFRGFACGSNGGAPRQPLTGWKDFARCRAEPNGLHEVYFEYDDELEYIARAKDIDREITRWAGTTEALFPVVVSALFDDAARSGEFAW